MKALYISAITILSIGVLYAGYFAYQHWGFFDYHYTLLTSEDVTNYQNELVRLAASDPTLAFTRFNEVLEDDPLSYNSCHGLAHQMGHAAYDAFGFGEAMKAQNAVCGGGYIHGVLEAHFGLLQEEDLLDSVSSLCSEGSNTCYHGLGHGLMIALDLDVSSSLGYCDLLPGVGARNCYDGVWMHIFDLEESGVSKESDLYFTAEETQGALALCAGHDDIYKSSCYFYLPRILAHDQQRSFQESVDLCALVEDSFAISCAAGSGHSNMKYHIANPNASLEACQAYKADELMNACKEGGLLYYLYSLETSDAETFNVEGVCDSLLSQQDRELCDKVAVYRSGL